MLIDLTNLSHYLHDKLTGKKIIIICVDCVHAGDVSARRRSIVIVFLIYSFINS